MKLSRAKYFVDLLTEINDKKDLEVFSQKINKNRNSVTRDFKEAQFIYACIYFNKGHTKYEINFHIKEILNEMRELIGISTLERNNSLNKIRNILIEEVIETNKRDFKQKYFSIEFNKETNKIILNDRNIKASSLLSFIYEKWSEGVITRREINEKNKRKVINDLFLIIKNININKKLSKYELDELNEFQLNVDKLEKIIENNSHDHVKEIKRFQNAIELRKLNDKLTTSFNKILQFKDVPISVFNELLKQLEWNNKEYHLNAIAATLRSIVEQLIVWLSSSLSSTEERIVSICKDRMSELLIVIKKEMNDPTVVENWLNKAYKNKRDVTNEQIKFIYNFYETKPSSNTSSNTSSETYNQILNGFIHGSHKIYVRGKYLGKIDKLKKVYSIINEIVDFIDWNSFKHLDEAIFNKLVWLKSNSAH
ncbi:MAG: hypothetical protein ACRDCJ_02100 [Metamycoplasmataceae bacterium]